MTALTIFGAIAVSAMLLFYAFEERAPRYVLFFAGACAASSAYGFLQGAWPFGVVEAIWAAVALQRWRGRTPTNRSATARPIACDMSALSTVERARYDIVRESMLNSVAGVSATRDAYRLQLEPSASLSEIAEWMALEHRCCPFLTLRLVLDAGLRSLEIGGSEMIKTFVGEEFRLVARV
jgi:hypothetical protein